MKKIILLSAIVILLFSSMAVGQFTAEVSPAETVFQGRKQGLAYLGIYDNVSSLVGGFRCGIGGYTDASIRFGLLDYKRFDNGFMFGGDLRYQLMELRINDPVDLSVGGLFEYSRVSSSNSYSLGGLVVGSRNIGITDDMDLWPFARLILRWDKYPGDSKFNLGFNPGVSLELSERTLVTGEFQFDDSFGFIMAIVFGL
ncbi:MAG: hypothetical protein J7K40_08935 [candidate division Zixibacteria bacterium]|nr:hypothetical protein [candidate division Zixibacteria bacterium]